MPNVLTLKQHDDVDNNISLIQLRANRLNAMQSTGPKDTTRTRNNALKHGYYARYDLIDNTEDESLQNIYKDILQDYRIESASGANIAKMAAWNLWRYHKLFALEMTLYSQGAPIDEVEKVFVMTQRLEKRYLNCIEALKKEVVYGVDMKDRVAKQDEERTASVQGIYREINEVLRG